MQATPRGTPEHLFTRATADVRFFTYQPALDAMIRYTSDRVSRTVTRRLDSARAGRIVASLMPFGNPFLEDEGQRKALFFEVLDEDVIATPVRAVNSMTR
jgi:hypothetical protein